MLRIWLVALASAALLVLTACSGGGVEPAPDPPASDAADLPLLADDRMIGTTLYGSGDLPEPGTPERRLLGDAVDAGLSGFTVYVDWGDLEPEPGRYTLEPFRNMLDALQDLGVTPVVNITVGDSDGYNLPPGLTDGSGGIADGVSLDDPDVLDRFGDLLDRVVPIVRDHGGFYLGVGNEVGEYLRDDTDERNAYVAFVDAARQRVHAMEPLLAVGVTLTSMSVREQSSVFRALRPVTDILPVNYGPIKPDFFVRDLDDIRPDFREVLAAYGDHPVIVQELTCPSPESMGASEAWQEGCFERLFAEIEETPRIRFASVFTFQDFEGDVCALIQDVLFGDELDDLPDEVARRLGDYLCNLGVIRPDGTPKPAWEVVLDGAGSVSGDG